MFSSMTSSQFDMNDSTSISFADKSVEYESSLVDESTEESVPQLLSSQSDEDDSISSPAKNWIFLRIVSSFRYTHLC